ncbi:MAG: hypothetical protein BIFFINMI_00444 [Phycisphaerae bacterium]|nr:hypothetical protein [Phycisphaerae bacterium]
MRKLFLSLGSSRVRLAIGLVLGGLLMAQVFTSLGPASTDVATAAAPPVNFSKDAALNQVSDKDRIENLAKTDHVALLKYCLAHFSERYADYTCTLARQERIAGKLGDRQIIDVKFKEKPFSVFMNWRTNPGQADRMAYVADGKNIMYLRPTGWPRKLWPSVERSPDAADVRSKSLRSVTEFGFANGLRSLIEVYETAAKRGDLVEASYVGANEKGVDGRPTFAIKRILRPSDDEDYPAKTTIVEIDQEWLIPVRIYGTDWRDGEDGQPRIKCDYVYTDIKFNVGLKDEEFTRQAVEKD